MSQADTLPAGVEEAPSNRAVTQVYEPGSVFKLVTFSAALAAGLITPNQVIQVPASLSMGSYTFHDAESHGTEDLTSSQILAQSSNVGTIEVAQRLGENRLLSQIGNLGFGKPTGLDFPGESQGLVPGASGLDGDLDRLHPHRPGRRRDRPADPRRLQRRGQRRGLRRPPPGPGHGEPVRGHDGHRASATHRVISPTTNAQLTPMLEGVVSSGTGTEAAIDGYTVAGKTGTAQIPDPNHLGYITGAYVGSFAGFAPAQNPVLSAVVVLDHPTPIYGGAVAAPVFSTIMAYALHHYGIPTTAAGDGLGLELGHRLHR